MSSSGRIIRGVAVSAPLPRDSSGVIRGPDGRIHQIERVGDAAVVQVYADGFEALPLDHKRLAWHLSQAAFAGRDIYTDQRYRHGLAMRDVIEAVLRHPAHVASEALNRVGRYARLFWINNGPHLYSTAQKFVMEGTPAELATAVRAAVADGARLPLAPGERPDDLVARLTPAFFDPDHDPFVTRKSPPAGADLLSAGANNLYDGVRLADLAAIVERYPVNSRLVKRDGVVVEEVCRVGGRYGLLLAHVVRHLRDAMPLAPPPMRQALSALVRFYETGEDADRRAYDIAWTRDIESPVDTINGFVEVHLDPRGIKGAWESLVFYEHPEKTARFARLARRAAVFESRMPFEPRFRRPTPTGISARAIETVTATGEAGPIVPFGINLPNDNEIRAQHGSKAVWLTNVNHAFDSSLDPALYGEFAWDDEEAARARRYAAPARELATTLHEVIGHSCGRTVEGLRGTPPEILREYYATIEEARADLVALYLMPDPELVELGLVPAADHVDLVRAAYEAFTRDALLQLRRIRSGREVELDHMRSRQLIVHWLRADGRAVSVRERDGRTFFLMIDAAAFREAVGRLLAEVQRIKSEADLRAARALVSRYGTWLDERLRDEVVARADRLHLRSYVGCVMPRLDPVWAADGTLADVHVSYPLDLTAQMLEYSAMSPRRAATAAD